MALAASQNDGALLKNLVPLNALSDEQLGPLLSRIVVEKVKKGGSLFLAGDTDYQNIYLLSGKVALMRDGREVDEVNSGSETARYPIAHEFPRKFEARAKSVVSYVRVDGQMLSDLLVRSQADEMEVSEADESGDWMTQLLQHPTFQQIPPANMQQVMMRMEQVNVSAGDVIIKQGDEGDYYYMISRGNCVVTRQADETGAPIKLAQLGPGNSFGEEALLSQMPRGGTVTMLTDGVLVRLGKDDFQDLVSAPLSHPVNYKEACEQISGGACWLDVRMPEAFEARHLDDAVNLPSFSLRFQTFNLSNDKHYVVCSERSGSAAASAFLLMERGFRVSFLNEELEQVFNKIENELAEAAASEANDASDEPSDSATIEEYEQKLAHEQTKLQRLEQLYLTTKQQLTDADAEKQQALAKQEASYGQKLAELKEQITVLQLELDDIREQDDSSSSDSEIYQAQLNELKPRLQQAEQLLEQQQQDWQEERERLAAQVDELSNELSAIRQRGEEALTEQQQAHDVLQQRLLAAEQAKDAFEEQKLSLEQVCEQLKGEVNDQQVLVETLEQQLAEMAASRESMASDQDQERTQQLELIEQLNSDLSEARGTLAEEQAQLQEEVVRHQQQIDALQQQLESEQDEKSALLQAREELERDINDKLSRIDALEHQLKDQSETREANTSHWEQQRAELRQEIESLNHELDRVRGVLEDDKQHYQERVGTLQQELESERDEKSLLEQQLSELEESNAVHSNHLKREQDQQLQQIESLNCELEAEREQHREELLRLQEQLDSLQQGLDNERAEKESLDQAKAQIEQEISGKSTRIEELERQLSELVESGESYATDWEREREEQTRQIETLNQHLEQEQELRKEEQSRFQQQLDALQQQLASESDEKGTLEQSRTALESDIACQAAQIESLEQQLNELAEKRETTASDWDQERSSQRQQIESLTRKLDEAQAGLERALAQETELSDMRQEMERLKQTMESEREVKRVMDQQVEQLQASLEQAEQSQQETEEALQETIDEIVRKRDATKMENRQLIERLQQLESGGQNGDSSATAELQEEMESLRQQNHESRLRIDELKMKLAESKKQTVDDDLLIELEELRNCNEELIKELESSSPNDQPGSSELMERLEETQRQVHETEKERDSALSRVSKMQGEIQHLRSVMEQYVGEIQAVRANNGDNEVGALHGELEVGRDLDDVATQQQLRQELDTLREALQARERLLEEAAASQRAMEDSLEERDEMVDRLQTALEDVVHNAESDGDSEGAKKRASSMLAKMFKKE